MNLTQKLLVFEDAYGEEVEVRKPPVLMQEEIRARYIELMKLAEKDYIQEMTFADGYTQVKKFRRSVDKVLELVNIDPKRLSIDLIAQLLFAHEEIDEETEEKQLNFQGALIEFIFGPPSGDPDLSSIKDKEIDLLANLIGDIWAYTEDFQETIQVLNTLDYEDLKKVLEARQEALTPPEEKMKKKQAAASKKLMENMKNAPKAPKEEMVEMSEDEMDKFF